MPSAQKSPELFLPSQGKDPVFVFLSKWVPSLMVNDSTTFPFSSRIWPMDPSVAVYVQVGVSLPEISPVASRNRAVLPTMARAAVVAEPVSAPEAAPVPEVAVDPRISTRSFIRNESEPAFRRAPSSSNEMVLTVASS